MTQQNNKDRFQRIDLESINWPERLTQHPFNLDPSVFNGVHQACPIEQDGKDRFRWDKKRMIYHCNNCKSGNGMALLMGVMNVNFVAALNLLRGAEMELPVRPLPKIKAVEKPVDKTWCKKLLQTTWDASIPIEGTPAEAYLKRRVPGLEIKFLSKYFRYHPNLEHTQLVPLEKGKTKKVKTRHPALLNMVVTETGIPVTIHRTYLSLDGYKANLPKGEIKKLMSTHKTFDGFGIHLNAGKTKSDEVIVCEGIETGLALLMATNNSKEVWAMMFCNNLAKAVIPKRFKTGIIASDHDLFNERLGVRPGEHNAEILATRLKAEGLNVILRKPKDEKVDYCDLWLQMSSKRLQLVA